MSVLDHRIREQRLAGLNKQNATECLSLPFATALSGTSKQHACRVIRCSEERIRVPNCA